MMTWKIGFALAGTLLVAAYGTGCEPIEGEDITPTETPSPTPIPSDPVAFEVYADCDDDGGGQVLYVGLDTYTSGYTLSSGMVEIYDDYTKEDYENDPDAAWTETHDLEKFDSGDGYEIWEQDLVIVGSFEDVVEDETSIFTCEIVDAGEATYVFSAVDSSGNDYVIAYGKHPDTYCAGCDTQD